MATLATGISATDTLLIIAGDVSGVEKGLRFRLDDEICDLAGFDRYVTVAGKRAPGSDRSRWIVERHVGTSAAVSHDAGTTVEAVVSASVSGDDLTVPIPFAGTGDGGSGIPQGGPLTEPLDVSDQALKGTDGGAGVAGGPLVLRAGFGNGGNAAAQIYLDGTTEEGEGGSVTLGAASGTAGQAGGYVVLQGGNGDDGADQRAAVYVYGGDGAGGKGRVRITSDGVQFYVKQAAHVADGATVDDIRDALIEAGWMAAS